MLLVERRRHRSGPLRVWDSYTRRFPFAGMYRLCHGLVRVAAHLIRFEALGFRYQMALLRETRENAFAFWQQA